MVDGGGCPLSGIDAEGGGGPTGTDGGTVPPLSGFRGGMPGIRMPRACVDEEPATYVYSGTYSPRSFIQRRKVSCGCCM